jgi:hypothetical protein
MTGRNDKPMNDDQHKKVVKFCEDISPQDTSLISDIQRAVMERHIPGVMLTEVFSEAVLEHIEAVESRERDYWKDWD